MIIDDKHDIGKFHHDGKFLRENPNLFGFFREFSHHWLWGVVAIIGGILGLFLSIKDLMDALKEEDEENFGYLESE